MIKKIAFIIIAAVCIYLYPSSSEAGLRGLPEGDPVVQLGAGAPLNTDELKNAHKEGKTILLLFGNPDHCIYCEKVWRSISDIQEADPKHVAAILTVHRASKFWGPESDAVLLGKTYGVAGEPWLFVIDRKGIIRLIYKGFVEKPQIEADLKKLFDSRN